MGNDRREEKRAYYLANKERKISQAKTYYTENKPRVLEAQKRRYQAGGAEFLARCAAYNRTSRARIKAEVMAYYSAGKNCCAVCGFNDVRALSIDHVDGRGCDHRRDRNLKPGSSTYKWLKTNGFPPGFQVLCMNCQFIKRHENSEQTGVSAHVNPTAVPRKSPDAKVIPGLKYQGVSRMRNRLVARITRNSKTINLGYFRLGREEEAAKNYDYHALNILGRGNVYLNFPDFDYSDFIPYRTVDYFALDQD